MLASEDIAILYSSLIGMFMGSGTISILYFMRGDRGLGEFEHKLALAVDDYDVAYLISKIISKIVGRTIKPISRRHFKRELWTIICKNKDLVCFMTEHACKLTEKTKTIVEKTDNTIKSWLYMFKLSKARIWGTLNKQRKTNTTIFQRLRAKNRNKYKGRTNMAQRSISITHTKASI